MAYKSIVAVASGQESDAHVFNAAARLAGQSSAHARVVPAYPDPAADFHCLWRSARGRFRRHSRVCAWKASAPSSNSWRAGFPKPRRARACSMVRSPTALD